MAPGVHPSNRGTEKNCPDAYPAVAGGAFRPRPPRWRPTLSGSAWKPIAVHRWSARAVEWVVEGPGDWKPPLVPATIATTEIWRGRRMAGSHLAAVTVGRLRPQLAWSLPPSTAPLATTRPDLPANVLEAVTRFAE